MGLQQGSVVKTLAQGIKEINAGRDIGPANILVVYRTGDTVGQQVAAYYQTRRAIPAANIISVPIAWLPTSNDMSKADADILLASVMSAITTLDIAAVVTCHWWPRTINSTGRVGALFNMPQYFNSLPSATRWNGFLSNTTAAPFIADYTSVVKYTGLKYFDVDVNSQEHVYGIKPPKNYYNIYGINYCIPHFRLEVSPVATGDTRISSASPLNYIKRIIDDSIAAEAAKYTDFGTVITTGSGSDSGVLGLIVAQTTYDEARGKAKKLYWDNLRVEAGPITRGLDISTYGLNLVYRTVTGSYLMRAIVLGTTHATVEPAWNTAFSGAQTVDGTATFIYIGTIPADSFPTGATTNTPDKPGFTFVSQSDVMFRAVGFDAYYSTTSQPEQASDIVYRQGAIVAFSQSYGFWPNPITSQDYEFGAPLPNNIADTACATATAISYANANLLNGNAFWFSSVNTTPTVGVSSGSVILKEAGVTKATIALSGTLRQQYATIKAALPVGWTMIIKDDFCESRSGNSIKNGACFAFGAASEPYTSGAIKGVSIIQNLWDGLNMGEAAYTVGLRTNKYFQLYMVGDPLYRPFGYRR